jgi:beta-lactamase class A
VLKNGLSLRYGTKTYTIAKKTVKSWLTYANAGSTVRVNSAKMKASLAALDIDTGVVRQMVSAQGVSADDLTDVDADDLPNVINYAKTAAALKTVLLAGSQSQKSKTVVTVLVTATAKKRAVALARELKEKAETSAALKTKLRALFGSAQVSAKVIDLKDSSTVLDMDSDTDFISASTYKLFVAYSMLKAVDDGSMNGEKVSWSSELDDTTLSECFTKMIVESDNACPQAWLKKYGYSTVSDEANAIGATNTHFAYEDMHTTAADLATLLTKLYKGTILSEDSRERLFTVMKEQEYRSGIPAGIGSNGTVADKVGFLDDYLHDAGIVYSEKGDYVMVFMTNDSSWSTIAQAAATVYAAL